MKKLIYLILTLALLFTLGCHRWERIVINDHVYYKHLKTGKLYTEEYIMALKEQQRRSHERNTIMLMGILSGEGINTPPNNDTYNNDTYDGTPTKGYLPPYKKDAYGPGIWSDGTGRPFQWQTNDGQTVPLGDVKPDAYGPGIGKDQFGRPVTPVPWK
jgi:hypothetical protein